MEQAKIRRYETFTDWLRAHASVITRPVAEVLNRLGVHPNTITVLAVVLSVGVGWVLARGYLLLGGTLVWLVSSLDALDGALARLSGAKSRFGAFLDSTFDRISEGLFLFGLLVWSLSQGRTTDVYLLFAVLLGSVMVSYTRARAEGVGYSCKVGMLTRVGRIVVMGAGLITGWVRPMLTVMAVLTWLTVAQRVLYVYRVSRYDP